MSCLLVLKKYTSCTAVCHHLHGPGQGRKSVHPPFAHSFHLQPGLVDEELIKYAWPQDVWFHVDKLSSAHVYLRMPDTMEWESIPDALLTDCAQLVKANSIEGAFEHRL